MPLVLCENVGCLESSKIECSPNVSMELCKGENNQWINGFHERFENGKNSTKVECCQYKDDIKMHFLKKINVTNVATFEREESYDGEKLVALTVFNDVQMQGNDKNE
uniref:Uncharacterized protein n=1 Tax=Panagrolaimus sp. ES5 TaxID=591445 RepID=A0AC34F4C3_9BILA